MARIAGGGRLQCLNIRAIIFLRVLHFGHRYTLHNIPTYLYTSGGDKLFRIFLNDSMMIIPMSKMIFLLPSHYFSQLIFLLRQGFVEVAGGAVLEAECGAVVTDRFL